MKENIGLVGIGLVGTALAEHLLAAGFGVVGFDVDAARCTRLEELGGRAVDGPAAVADASRRVLLSLMTTDIVEKVVEGRGGLLAGQAAPRCIIDTTTGDPDRTAALAERLARRSVPYLDATISGSSRQIRDRQALFMVGGAKDAFDACADLFNAVTEKAVHLGPSGSGSKAKLASNLILGLNRLALAEGLVFAEALGLELEPFLELLKRSPAYSVAMDVKGHKMLSGDFAPQAKIAQHHKDVTIILDYAGKAGVKLPLTQTHLALLAAAIQAGDGELDNAAVIRQIRRRATGRPE